MSSTTTDADLFLILQVFDPEGNEVVLQGAVDPHTPIGQGWLRASHRALDPELSTEYRPFHRHDEVRPLEPGRPETLDVEIWPTSIVVPPGYRVALWIRGSDYVYRGSTTATTLSHFKGTEMRGVGIYTHDDPVDRPHELFGGITTIHCGSRSSLLLPVIPGLPPPGA